MNEGETLDFDFDAPTSGEGGEATDTVEGGETDSNPLIDGLLSTEPEIGVETAKDTLDTDSNAVAHGYIGLRKFIKGAMDSLGINMGDGGGLPAAGHFGLAGVYSFRDRQEDGGQPDSEGGEGRRGRDLEPDGEEMFAGPQ